MLYYVLINVGIKTTTEIIITANNQRLESRKKKMLISQWFFKKKSSAMKKRTSFLDFFMLNEKMYIYSKHFACANLFKILNQEHYTYIT